MIWKVIDTRKPEIVVMSETLEEEVCLIRIKSVRRGAHYADCLLKKTTKHNKYDVNQ